MQNSQTKASTQMPKTYIKVPKFNTRFMNIVISTYYIFESEQKW